jgi:hypothetical protein
MKYAALTANRKKNLNTAKAEILGIAPYPHPRFAPSRDMSSPAVLKPSKLISRSGAYFSVE